MSKNRKNMIAASMLLVSSLVVLFGSHSRGAWLGLAGAFGVWVLLTVPKRLGGLLLIAGTALVMVAAFGTYQYRDTDFVQDVVLHDNPSEGGDISSNQGHLQSLEDGIENVAQSPVIGCGAGCAGPASVRSDGGAQFSENYFIQTAEESGVVGLGLLIAIFSYVAYLLYKRKDEDFARVLLASFVGIGVASLTAHAWADDTIAYIWWGIAGLYLYNKSVGISNGKTKNKIT
jgi:O-antigen ligase